MAYHFEQCIHLLLCGFDESLVVARIFCESLDLLRSELIAVHHCAPQDVDSALLEHPFFLGRQDPGR